MKRCLFASLVILFIRLSADAQPLQSADRKAMQDVLDRQVVCWNKGDLLCFMDGYWKSDSLQFIGKSGIQYGWGETLYNYRKTYPDKAAMGTLRFEVVAVQGIGAEAAYMTGRWYLRREKDGDLEGWFTLLWRKIGGKWVIVADHSS
jgi:hypothetical protein